MDDVGRYRLHSVLVGVRVALEDALVTMGQLIDALDACRQAVVLDARDTRAHK